MAFLALVDAPLSSESMKFPVFSLLTGNFETETSSHVTAPSSGESCKPDHPSSKIPVSRDSLGVSISGQPGATVRPRRKRSWIPGADAFQLAEGNTDGHGRREVAQHHR